MQKNYKAFAILSLLLFTALFTQAQSAGDMLERGIHVKKNEAIFLYLDGKIIKYDLAKSAADPANPLKFLPIPDSAIFMSSGGGSVVRIHPLNPLNYSYTSENIVIVDPVNEQLADAFRSILDVTKQFEKLQNKAHKLGDDGEPEQDYTWKVLGKIRALLRTDKQAAIKTEFNSLKALDFKSQGQTLANIAAIKANIVPIAAHFTKIKGEIDAVKIIVDEIVPDDEFSFTYQFALKSVLTELTTTYTEQNKRLTNLNAALKLVEAAANAAAAEPVGFTWTVKLEDVPAEKGKISIYTVTIKQAGFQLSDKDEIVAFEGKEVYKATFRMHKFMPFIPEFSAGTAYTFFSYATFGTAEVNGQAVVANGPDKKVKNLNFTAMINFNAYIPNSPIHPLIQIGVGANSEIPTLLLGGGLRFDSGKNKLFAITGGIAFTAIKQLDKLKVGDAISGTAELEKDLKYEFTKKPHGYLGIQYNF